MKFRRGAALFLLAACLLTGCSGKTRGPTEPTVPNQSTQNGDVPSDPSGAAQETPGESQNGVTGAEEAVGTNGNANNPHGGTTGGSGNAAGGSVSSSGSAGSGKQATNVTSDGKLQFSQFGRYSGQYVEDGTDEPVEDVAVMLITNLSGEFLDYATLTFDIDGKAAAFQVTGLPAGRSAWVLESQRMTVSSGAVFTYMDDLSAFRSDAVASAEELTTAAEAGVIAVKNNARETLHEVYIYYRQLHTDGNYLGGITYRASAGDVEAGATVAVVAGHFDPEKCEIVRVSWNPDVE